MGVGPEDRTTKTCGRFNKGFRWRMGHFCRVEYKLHRGNFPNNSNRIARFKLANSIIQEKVLGNDPRRDGCVSWYIIGKQLFQFANSWCQVLHRSWRSFLLVVCELEVGVCRIDCFRFERRSFGSPGPESEKTDEIGLGLGLKRGLVAEFLTVMSLVERFLTGRRASSAIGQSHFAVEGQWVAMSACLDILPSSVG